VGLTGCEKTTTTTQTPAGTRSTTTLEPTAQTQQAVKRAGEAVVDSAITAKVKTALLADPEVKGLAVDVDTHDGVVALQGRVASRALADRAAELARGIDGVKSVDNRLVADAGAGTAVDRAGEKTAATLDRAGAKAEAALDRTGDTLADAAITAKVKSAFLADSQVKGLAIDVDTKAGVVTLNGALASTANVERAVDIARKVEGVKSVENQLTVKSSG
jgi:hyperosmotically inducible protein